MNTISEDRRIRVAVLMGGSSNERSVSLSTGKQIVAALDNDRYCVTPIDTADLLSITGESTPRPLEVSGSSEVREETHSFTNDGDETVSAGLIRSDHTPPLGRADVVFIALHGKGGEDGVVQGLLQFLGLRYTGSGVLASALAMNKMMSKRLFAATGIPVIPDVVVSELDLNADNKQATCDMIASRLSFPVFVKPNSEGSTFGCTLVEEGADQYEKLCMALENGIKYDTHVLVERYVRGIELTIGVLENQDGLPEPLPVVEIVPRSKYYDYESKYADGGSEHIIPARIDAELTRAAQSQAVMCHQTLGCRGMSRTDMILADGILFVLEVNTIPGMTPTSLLPQAAAHAGIAFPDLLDRIIGSAYRDSTNAQADR